MTNLSILISSAGRRVELIRCFRQDARDLGVTLDVIAVDGDPEWSAACQEADRRYRVPRCVDLGFCDALLEIANRERVSLVIPTIDTELAVLAEARPRFLASGIDVIVSSPSAVGLARDKRSTMACLAAAGIATPRTAVVDDVLGDRASWTLPVILKPIDGSCSRGIVRAEGWDEVDAFSGRGDLIVQELLRGREYTINCFTDASGDLIAVVPHWRREIRGGEVSKAETVLHRPLMSIAQGINAAIPGLHGPWCFQAMEDDQGRIGVIEVNARFGGGYPLAHHAGAVFSRWLIEAQLGLRSSMSASWRAGVRMLRCDESFFLG